MRLCALAPILLSACAASPTPTPTQTLTIFAASSLLGAFTEMGDSFESAHPAVSVALNFDGSQSLRAQIEQGAMADVFASANAEEIEALAAQSLIATSQPFAANSLIVILPSANTAGIQSLADLARPGLFLVLAANDVPVGRYSRQALEKLNAQFGADYSTRVLANLVSDESNAKQIVAKVQLGEADAGIVYVSDSVAAPDLLTLAIPPEYNVTAEYPIAALANAPHPELAAEFIAFVLSADGQSILEKWGFRPVK